MKNYKKIKNFFEFLEKEENKVMPIEVAVLNKFDLNKYENTTVPNVSFIKEPKLKFLPDNLTVEDFFSVQLCKNFNKLPENLTLKGSASFSETNIEYFPESFNFYGKTIYIYDSPLSNNYDEEYLKKRFPSIELVINDSKRRFQIEHL